MKNLFKIGIAALMAFSLLFSCTGSGGEEGEEDITGTLLILPDKAEIFDNSSDKVTFTVTLNGEDITPQARIKNMKTREYLPEGQNTYTSSVVGEVEFTGEYKNLSTSRVKINVKPEELVFRADKGEIYSDNVEKITFTVTLHGEDVSAGTTIHNLTTGQDLPVGQKTFATLDAGDYEFVARYGRLESATVPVNVKFAVALEADQLYLFPNGIETTFFTVKHKGQDVTSLASVKNERTGQTLQLSDGKYSFTMNDDNETQFIATYEGLISNKLTIGPKKFYRNVGMLRFTASWCGPCTNLASSLSAAVADYPDRLVYAAVHTSDDVMEYSGFFTMMTQLGLASGATYSVPQCSFDFRTSLRGEVAKTAIINTLKAEVENYPATSGIKVTSEISGNNALVTVTVSSSVERQYGLAVALLEDGLIGYQNGAGSNYVHNNTLRSYATNFMGDDIGTIQKYGNTTVSYTIELGTYVKDNCKLFIYTTYQEGGKTYINNAVYSPIDGETPYRFEPAAN